MTTECRWPLCPGKSTGENPAFKNLPEFGNPPISRITKRVLIVKDIFTYDWYDGRPASYPLITEVEAGSGYVEVTNFGRAATDLSGWSISASGGKWTFSQRTVLGAGTTLVVARSEADLNARFGGAQLVVEVPGLKLRPDRDTVTLRSRDGIVDSLSWGNDRPGWTEQGPAAGALCRSNPGKDTNTSLDWSNAPRGTPGAPGCGT